MASSTSVTQCVVGFAWPNHLNKVQPLHDKVKPLEPPTALDFLLKPELIADTDQPAIELNAEKMAKYREEMRKFYYGTARFPTYLDQLGISYPTLKKQGQ